MNDLGKQINALLGSSGKSAPEMNHALKLLGNGSMASGLKRIADFFAQETKIGIAKGAAGGVVITIFIIGLSILIKRKIDKNKKHMEEGEAILKGLEKGFADYKDTLDEDTSCGSV